MKPGPTGKFPRGKFNKDDEGELFLGMAVQDKTLIINFGRSVVWIGLDLATAEQFAAALDKHIKQLREEVER